MVNRRVKSGGMALILMATVLGMTLANPGLSAETRGVAESLTAIPVSSGPTVDGSVDALWAGATEMTTSNGIAMRAAYTSTDLYLLVIWSDSTKDDFRRQWSWDATGGEWVRASNNEDRLAILWNLNDSTATFDTESCQAACHIPTNTSRSVMATSAPGETVDLWHWKATRSNPTGWADDQWLDDTRLPDADPLWTTDPGEAREAAHHSDSKTSGGYSDNLQTLNNGTDDLTVPKYWEPSATGDDAVYITQSEIDAGEAKLIVSVDAANALTDEDSAVVPNTATMPGYTTSQPVGSRGDITAGGVWTPNTWTVELRRALDTGNPDDAQFTDTSDSASYAFGVARFDNAGGMSHITSGSNAYQLEFAQPNLPPTDLAIDVTPGTTDVRVGDVLTFEGQGTDPEGQTLTYSWSFGDGDAADGAQATHAYDEAGTYTVTLTVSDGVIEATETVQITVEEKPAEAGLDLVLIAGIVLLIVVIVAALGYVMLRRRR